ncbi:hypothetical protein LEP1GSC125_1394 [Leptospira mayottensis 200901122]|uniref:Uncharacterized protein n=1 Tax=Leptospira mayottensis 200901122 TaxID=1193010 RepID=A0AA87MND4_9LEPT|nr:hypothetical protein LEP1GSC125_1394 [Leptospira mayottensis 200901122]
MRRETLREDRHGPTLLKVKIKKRSTKSVSSSLKKFARVHT